MDDPSVRTGKCGSMAGGPAAAAFRWAHPPAAPGGDRAMVEIARTRLATLMERETRRFAAERPKSRDLFERAQASLLGGVPMNWMVRWSGPFPLFVREARGAHFTDVDGHRYLDLCLGDTGAMTGHSPGP